MSEWISVKDRLPEFIEGKDITENVLANLSSGSLILACRFADMDGWYWCQSAVYYGDMRTAEAEADDDYDITHWMPLPEPPK